jgi:FAD/FMN-containing dehydrogenase
VYYNPGSELKGFGDQYYSTFQRVVIPACVVTPSSGDDVSQALQIIKQYRCIFAVKSGGHSMFTGASNAPSGITLDLKMFDDVVPDEAGLVTRVGTGNRWADVYKVLEPLNRMVVGGRHSGVGVGGFILGGVSEARS